MVKPGETPPKDREIGQGMRPGHISNHLAAHLWLVAYLPWMLKVDFAGKNHPEVVVDIYDIPLFG